MNIVAIMNCCSNVTGKKVQRQEEDLMKRWTRFVNRKDWQSSSSSYICIKHLEEKCYKKGKNAHLFGRVS